jgi:hypothetical protein
MRTLTSIVLASLASLTAASSSQAAVFGPFATAVGALRTVATTAQATNGAINATSLLKVTRCSGAVETPAWVVAGPTCTATAADYQISMTVVSATQTRVRIAATGATCDIRQIVFGTPNTRCGFDLTLPNPGTAGSAAGFNPAPVAGSLVGAWMATVRLENAVRIGGAAPVGDLYSVMVVSFNSCFDINDRIEFIVDTDYIN